MSSTQRIRLIETMVSWIAPQAMVFLGKMMNPMSGKTERDLPAARAMIDLLAELEEKTTGRLEDEERRLLQKTLTELRLNYLDEVGKPEPSKPDAGEESGEISGSGPGTEPAYAGDEVHPDDAEEGTADPGSHKSSDKPVEG
jgi:hypothetical protein